MTDWFDAISKGLGIGMDAVELAQKVVELKDAMTAAPQGQVQPAPAMPAPQMQPFVPQMADQFAGGSAWLPQLQAIAAQHGNAWVPDQTQGFAGIDLTGIWAPPMNPADQTYFRQFGPYLNTITGIGGIPVAYGEGIFDPSQSMIYVTGSYISGAPMQVAAQLMPNWTQQGVVASVNEFGMPFQMPLFMSKIA